MAVSVQINLQLKMNCLRIDAQYLVWVSIRETLRADPFRGEFAGFVVFPTTICVVLQTSQGVFIQDELAVIDENNPDLQ